MRASVCSDVSVCATAAKRHRKNNASDEIRKRRSATHRRKECNHDMCPRVGNDCNDCAKPPCLLIPSILHAASSSLPDRSSECDSPGCTGEERQLGHRRAERAGKGGICVGPHAGGHRLIPIVSVARGWPIFRWLLVLMKPVFHTRTHATDLKRSLLHGRRRVPDRFRAPQLAAVRH